MRTYPNVCCSLASLCRRAIPGCIVHIIKNDEIPFPELVSLLDQFSAVVIGPGPGSPDEDKDVGVVKKIWKLADEHLLPVFGVCLGLQSLCIEHGATLKRLQVVKHGQVSRIHHDRHDIFNDVDQVEAVRYHSLHVSLSGDEPLEALAWADDGEENGRVLMAVKHNDKPFWAVQYHPESVRTHGGGEEVLRNFWRLARKWSKRNRRNVHPWTHEAATCIGPPWPLIHSASNTQTPLPTDNHVSTRILEGPEWSIPAICELLGVDKESSDFVLLDSAAQPGRFSIIGCLRPTTPKITYNVGDGQVHIQDGHDHFRLEDVGADIWSWLAGFMQSRKARGGSEEIPFWGGFVGLLSYELGVSSLSATLSPREASRRSVHSDVNLVFVERSIVVDSKTGRLYIQSLLSHDDAWLSDMVSQFETMRNMMGSINSSEMEFESKGTVPTTPPNVALPDKATYISRIKDAQEFLFSGDSYELCLTAPTRISVPVPPRDLRGSSSWGLYKSVRTRNPAPHSAYLRLHPSTLISSSPERFLSFSRSPSVCQLRPIKGTVRKGPGVNRAVAEQALVGSVKEVAENLMIVDLIRHDLHGVVGDDVEVKQFCGVEEYETVWQLVSVIEGKLLHGTELDGNLDLGWEVLRRSLPPGKSDPVYIII